MDPVIPIADLQPIYSVAEVERAAEDGAARRNEGLKSWYERMRELGCDTLIVETGTPVAGEPSPSLENLKTAGFHVAFVRRAFAPPGTTWSGRRA